MKTARCIAGHFHPTPFIRWLTCGLPSLLGVWLASVGVASATAPPPPNDYCSNAIVIPANLGFPQWTPVIWDMSGATNDEVSVSPNNCWSVPPPSRRSVWYRFAPTNSGTFGFSTAEGTKTYTNLNTVVAIYETTNGCAGPLILINCGHDSGEELRAKAYANLSAGRDYLIYVAIWYFSDSDGTNTLELLVDYWEPPTNDACANAYEIPSNAVFPFRTPTFDIAAASNEMPWPLPDCEPDAIRGIWFKFRPLIKSRYALSTCFELTANQVRDTIIAVYEAPQGCNGNPTPVQCIDDDETQTCGDSYQSHIETELDAGMDYFIGIWQLPDARFEDPVQPGTSFVQLYLNDMNRLKIKNQNLGEGIFQIVFPALPNRLYRLEGSTNLISWSLVATNYTFFQTNSVFQLDVSDPNLRLHPPYHFFRIQAP